MSRKTSSTDRIAKKRGDQTLENLITVTAPEVKGAHDSDFLIEDGKAYIVYMANDVQPGEAPQWPFIYNALSVVNLSTGCVESTETFAASEMEYANEILPVGSCFVPRILQRDERTLRCFFASQNPGERQSQIWYIDYDLIEGEFRWEIYRVQIRTDQGIFPMQPQHLYRHLAARGFTGEPVSFGLYMIDSFKRFDGRTYGVLNNFPGGQTAWSVMNESMDRFTVLGGFFLPEDAKLTESAVNRLPDGTWMAISRQENRGENYMFSTSPDGRNWSDHEYRDMIRNGTSSKPTFDYLNGRYWLGWNEASTINNAFRSVFNLDTSSDGRKWERWFRFETDRSFQYPVFREHDNTIYLTVTQGDDSESRKERIMFGELMR